MRAPVEAALARLSPLGDRVAAGGPIGPLTTYRVGGPAAVRVTAVSVADLDLVAAAVADSGLGVLIVGRGSNLLVSDAGFAGIAVLLDGDPTAFGAIRIDGTGVTAGAAVALPALARQTVEAGLTGFEWAVGVPGSVGGGVRMNAGGHGSDMSRHLTSVSVYDLAAGARRELTLVDLDYGYRCSAIGPADVVR